MSTSIKVVHIITGLEIGGAETMLMKLLYSESGIKHSSVVVSLTGIGTLGQKLQAEGFTVHALNMRHPSKLPFNFWQLVQILRKYQPEIIQTWLYHADFFGGIVGFMAGYRRIVWNIRSTAPTLSRFRNYLIMKTCALLSHFIPQKIICVAEASKEAYSNSGFNKKKMVVIPNGFDFIKFDTIKNNRLRIRDEFAIQDTDVVIGCVGRYHRDKGQDVFIEAASLVNKAIHQKVWFMLVGRNCDADNVALMSLIASKKLGASFILSGQRQDIPDCLAAMDIFCMPSRTEGFPNGLGEAMAMELPCVATNVGDTHVLLGDEGVLVAPEDPNALALALIEIINLQTELRVALGKRASNRVRTHFSIERARQSFYSVYKELLG